MVPAAWAGYSYSYAVYGYRASTYSYGYGSVDAARKSADANQYIGCSVQHSAGSDYVSCAARDAAGNYFSCYSYDLGMVDAAAGINAASYIYFQADAYGVCSSLTISNYSYNIVL